MRHRKPPSPPTATGSGDLPDGIVHISEPLAKLFGALPGQSDPPRQGKPDPALAPLLSQDDLIDILNTSRRTVERLRSSGKLPPPDLHIGKCPRWKAETVRRWIDEQSRKGVKA